MVAVYQPGEVLGKTGTPSPNVYTPGTLYSPSLAGNWVTWDNAESVTYIPTQIGVNPPAGFTVQHSLWTVIRKELLDANSPLIDMDNTIVLPGAFLQGVTPKAKDIIQRADGTRWVVGINTVKSLVGGDFEVSVKKAHVGAA